VTPELRLFLDDVDVFQTSLAAFGLAYLVGALCLVSWVVGRRG
jgi:hypothetical protein